MTMPDNACVTIKGRVGRFIAPDRVIGWALAVGITDPVRIDVRYCGETIGSGLADHLSKNRGERCVFDIKLKANLSEPEVASDDFAVFVTRDPVCVKLTKSNKIIDAGPRIPLLSVGLRELTAVNVAVGSVSDDGVAIIGRDGFIFLVGGSNHVGSMYQASDHGHSDRWLELVRNRASACVGFGAKFLQVFIPEKSTVLPELFPTEINVPSPLYANLKAKICGDPALKGRNLFFENELNDVDSRRSAFRRTDSHLTALGAKLLFDAQLRLFGGEVSYRVGEPSHSVHECDLGEKFSCPKILEVVDMYDGVYVDGETMKPDVIYEHVPKHGHIGTIRVYRNSRAPLPQRVVIFANSFYWGGGSSGGQCWWFSRCFQELHFVWSPSFQPNYVEKHRPDIVIAQTIERFMRRLPDA